MGCFKRFCVVGAVFGVLAWGAGGVASADPGNGCTVNGAPPGQYVSNVAQTVGNNGENNPGNSMNPSPPYVPFVVGCNPNS
jgi:hypothetical protein